MVRSAQTQAKALALRAQGFSYEEIAAECGLRSKSSAWTAVMNALQSTRAENIDEVRALELMRLDDITRRLWPRVQACDLRAISTYLKVSERRSKITGLDTYRYQVTGADGGPVKVQVVEDVTRFQAFLHSKVIELATGKPASLQPGDESGDESGDNDADTDPDSSDPSSSVIDGEVEEADLAEGDQDARGSWAAAPDDGRPAEDAQDDPPRLHLATSSSAAEADGQAGGPEDS